LKLIALALFKLGRFKEASDVLNEILTVSPTDSENTKIKRYSVHA
jgi:Flp pilus assembly protein TadD